MFDIIFIEPFYDGSHRTLIDLLHQTFINRSILIKLPGIKWQWRARCSALILSQEIPENKNEIKKYLFTSSILNLSELLSLRMDLNDFKKIIYFHENDLIYPKQNAKQEQRDYQYGYNQILSALVADLCLFNSEYNRTSFLENLGPFLHRIPSPKPNTEIIRQNIEKKSKIFYFPLTKMNLSLSSLNQNEKFGPLVIVWPHRWEHDKDPETFFSILIQLYREYSIKFQLIILGQSFNEKPKVFDEILTILPSDYILHCGFVQSKIDYENLLFKGDLVVSTAQHEFFGVAMLEACRAGCIPLVPQRLVYQEIYKNQIYFYRTKTQLFKKLKYFCLHPDYVRSQIEKFDTKSFEWDLNSSLREQYYSLFN